MLASEQSAVAMGTISLTEYEDWDGDLSEEDADYVLSQLSPKIGIRRRVQDGRYVLNPNQFVGVITLPSRRRLESHPKVPLRNLFYMLAVVFDLPSPFREQLAKFAKLEELLEFVVFFFAGLVEKRIDHGLYRSYVEREENLTTVRGRIGFVEDLRRNHVMRHRTYCRYDEFSWDIPENQIIRQVLHLLGGWGFRRSLRLRLHRLDAALAEVAPAVLPASALDQFQYNRFNEDYREIHRFCRLFLQGASLSEESGPFDFRTFLVDMNKLFEKFVTQVLRERSGGDVTVHDQVPIHLGYEQKVPMQPDIVLSREGKIGVVADCKYKRLVPGEFKNHDVYQMLAYCTATRVQRGLLIYPLHAALVRDLVAVRNTDTLIHQLTIDLGKKGIGELDQECDAFARRVLGWTGDGG